MSIANGIVILPALQTAAFCTAILYFKTHFAFIAVGGAKMKAGARAPEDTYQVRSGEVVLSLFLFSFGIVVAVLEKAERCAGRVERSPRFGRAIAVF